MDWANEWWRKLYTRETPEDTMLTWQGRVVWPLLIMRCDPGGFLEAAKGPRRIRSVATLLRVPDEVVSPGIADLLEDTRLVELDGGYYLRNFEEAQRARKSAAQRMRETRGRRDVLRNATGRDVSQRNRSDKTSADLKRGRAADAAPFEPVAAVVDQAGRRGVGKKSSSPIFKSAPPTHLPALALTPEHASLVDCWNAQRDVLGLSHESLANPTQVRNATALLEHFELKHPDEKWELLERYFHNMLRAKGFDRRTLANVIKFNTWDNRLPDAIVDLRVAAEKAAAKKKTRQWY